MTQEEKDAQEFEDLKEKLEIITKQKQMLGLIRDRISTESCLSI